MKVSSNKVRHFKEGEMLIKAIQNTFIGKDLLSLLDRKHNKNGYSLKLTGRVYLSCGSRTFIEYTDSGKWKYESLGQSKLFGKEEYDTIDELLRGAWVKILIKSNPTGIKRKDLLDWASNFNCSAWNKGLSFEEIIKMYYEQNGDCYYINPECTIFDGQCYKDIFQMLGSCVYFGRDLKGQNNLYIKPLMSILETSKEIRKFWDEFINLLSPGLVDIEDKFKERNVWLSIRSSSTKNKKIVQRLYYNRTHSTVTLGAKNKEDMEIKILKILNEHIGNIGIVPTNILYPFKQFLMEIFSSKTDDKPSILNGLVWAVNKEPNMISVIPKKYKNKVMKKVGFSKELVIAIKECHNYGIF